MLMVRNNGWKTIGRLKSCFSTISTKKRSSFDHVNFSVAREISRLSILMIPVQSLTSLTLDLTLFFVRFSELIEAIEQVCELQANLTVIPRKEFERKRAPDGRLYYKLFYAIAMTFKNSISFELLFNGKSYETVFAKY
jgi:hypothetical protein